jgi:hypothetical protein
MQSFTSSKWKPLLIFLGLCSASVAVVVVSARLSYLINGQPNEEEIELPYKAVQVSGPVRAITSVPTRSVKEAWDLLQPNELVLGVVVGDKARAYPLNFLKDILHNEVLNDTLAEEPIVVTFCKLLS